MNKIKRKIRRLFLSRKWKHLDTLNPDFALERTESGHKVFWQNSCIGQLSSVEGLENKYRGSCFIVATGPSLAGVDLRSVSDYDTFSVNGGIKKFNEYGMKPTHVVATDRRFFESHPDLVAQSVACGANCFFSPVGISTMCETRIQLPDASKGYLVENIAKKYDQPLSSDKEILQRFGPSKDIYLSSEYPSKEGVIGFSCNARAGFFTFKTVVGSAVQLAVWMGYKNIFILGMDLGGTGLSYFYKNENKKSPGIMKDFEPYIRVSFELTRRAMDDLGFKVYNLSERSLLSEKIIPKITLEEALAIAKKE